MKEKIGAAVLASALAVSGSGIAETNELIDKLLVTPDPIVETGVMSSQRELDLTSQQEKEEVDKRFTEFLSGEGEYSEESLAKRRFYFHNSTSKADLGFCGHDSNNILFQGVLLGCFQKENRDFLMVGVKDTLGRRVVSVVEWPINELLSAYSAVPVLEMDGYYTTASYKVKKMSSRDEIGFFLKDKVGDVVVFNISNLNEKKVSEGDFKSLDEKKLRFFTDFVVPRWANSIDFVSGILKPSIKEVRLTPSEVDFISSLKEKELFSVSSYNEYMSMSNFQFDSTPVLNIIEYNTLLH